MCWVIHSLDDQHHLTFTVDSSSDFQLEFFTDCDYDALQVFAKTGPTCHLYPKIIQLITSTCAVHIKHVFM